MQGQGAEGELPDNDMKVTEHQSELCLEIDNYLVYTFTNYSK